MPRWRDLYEVFLKHRGTFLLWLLANTGGVLVVYMAAGTIWIFQRTHGTYLPGPEAFLSMGAISVAVAGASYISFPRPESEHLYPVLSHLWVVLVMLVYGFLIAMDVREPVISRSSVLWIAIVISLLCLFWSAVIWLHEQGLRQDAEQVAAPAAEQPPAQLAQVAARLPKIEPDERPGEE